MDSGRGYHPLKPLNNSRSRSEAGPLDFSFRRIKNVTDLVEEEEDDGYSVTPPITSDHGDISKSTGDGDTSSSLATTNTEGTEESLSKGDFPSSPTNVKRRIKSRSKCLRLNNNSLTTVDGLPQILRSLFLQPMNLSWLDLSFNRLTDISTTFCDLPYLQILYLHGNCIKVLSQVENLRPATHLKKLTLHGNPIENVKNYRYTALTTVPSLNEFDFSCVVKSDRDNAQVWRKNHESLVERRRNAKRRKAQLEMEV